MFLRLTSSYVKSLGKVRKRSISFSFVPMCCDIFGTDTKNSISAKQISNYFSAYTNNVEKRYNKNKL